MYQDDPEAIKDKFMWLGKILDANYKRADLEQEINKLIHLTKFRQVILLSCLKRDKDLFGGNLGECTKPPVDTPLKDDFKTYHARSFPILVINLEVFLRFR